MTAIFTESEYEIELSAVQGPAGASQSVNYVAQTLTAEQKTQARDNIDALAKSIGSTANLPLITTASGVVTTGSFGTTAGTFCEGNDSRVADLPRNLSLTQISAPSTRCTATVGSAGNLTGTFRYYVTYVTAFGETEPGIESFSVSPSSQRVDITEIPLGPSGVVSRKLWRGTVVGQEQFNLKLVTTIADNTTTTYTDNTASLSTACSRRNSSGGYWSMNDDPVAIIGSSLVSFGYGNGIDPIGIQNVQFGIECGKQITLGYWNSLFGYLAGRDITTGYENSYFGFIAGRDTTTGWYNCAFGGQTLSANTSGKNNIAVGFSALAFNTTGFDNTALGTFACNEHVDSEGVVAVGINAARFLANGSTACTSNRVGVYIGYDAKASADDVENEIVIGYNAIGNGTNTVTIGNTSIINTYLRGTVNVAAFIASGTATFNDPAIFNDTSTFNDTIKVSKGDVNADTYPTRVSSVAFSRSDLPTSYLNRITNSFSSVAAQSTMNFEVGDGSGSGYIVVLSMRGNGLSVFNGPVELNGAVSKGDINADTYDTRVDSLVFCRGDLPTSYRNKITNSFAGTASSSTMNFEVGDGSGSGYVVPLSLRGNGTSIFNGAATFNGSVKVSSAGTPVTSVLSATATLDFPSIATNDTHTLTITVTGAAAGDSVFLGVPAGLDAGLIFCASVTAADTVTIRMHNSTGGSVDPASATFRATVIKF